MTVSKFYSFSIRPKGIAMDFSRKDKLIGDLSDYCLDVQYIAIHMNEVEAYQKAEIKIEVKILKMENAKLKKQLENTKIISIISYMVT